MIPFGNETVTLYHRTRATDAGGKSHDEWTRHVLTDCSWRQKAAQTMGDNAALRTVETVCRIPAGQIKPSVGDALLPGEIDAEAETARAVGQLLEQYREAGAFRVASVADNARPGNPLPHYAARGD